MQATQTLVPTKLSESSCLLWQKPYQADGKTLLRLSDNLFLYVYSGLYDSQEDFDTWIDNCSRLAREYNNQVSMVRNKYFQGTDELFILLTTYGGSREKEKIKERIEELVAQYMRDRLESEDLRVLESLEIKEDEIDAPAIFQAFVRAAGLESSVSISDSDGSMRSSVTAESFLSTISSLNLNEREDSGYFSAP